MAIFRINKTKDYTVMSNSHFMEKEMSLKAKGLLSLMLSLPEEWNYSIGGLVTLSKDGKDSVMKALNELERFGYLLRTQVKDDKGKWVGYVYDIFEKPNTEKPNTEKPNTEKPNTEKPNTEKPTQLNTNILNTNKENIKELKESIKEVFDYWNTKNIIVHRELTEDFKKAIEKALKNYTVEDIKKYIDRYVTVLNDKDYFFSTKWTLILFLTRKGGIADFTDEGSKWASYLNRQKIKTTRESTFMQRNYTKEELDSMVDDIDDIDF